MNEKRDERRKRAIQLWARRTYRVGCNCPKREDRRQVARRDEAHHWACGVNR